MPIKATDFQKQFYPDFPGEVASYAFDKYASGENAEPERKAHNTDQQVVVEAPAPVKFEKKEAPVQAKPVQEVKTAPVVQNVAPA